MTDILIGILIAILILILIYVAKHPPQRKRRIRRSSRPTKVLPWFDTHRRK